MKKQFLSFVRKEFYHILRDYRTMMVLFGMPVIQMLIFGFALSNEVKNSPIAIFDASSDEASRSLAVRLDASRYFDLRLNAHSMAEVESAFNRNKIKLAVVIPQHFRQDLLHHHKAQIQFLADASDPNEATTLTNYAQAIVADYQNELFGNARLPYEIKIENRMLYNPQLIGAYNFVPGVMAMILMLISSLMTAVAIVREKELGTMEVLLVSPMRPLLVIIAKVVPYLTLSLINVINILLLSYFVLDVPIRGSLLLVLGSATLFIICSLALGLLISTVTNSQRTAMFASMMGLMLPTILFSGFMFPIENMPYAMQLITNIVPSRWFFSIVKNVMIMGLRWHDVVLEMAILLGMTLFFVAVSVRKFKVRLE